MIEVEPGVKVLAHCHWQADRQNRLTVVMVHGLEGSSDSQYMLGIAAKGLALGMNVVRMNQRNWAVPKARLPRSTIRDARRMWRPWPRI